MSRPDYFSDVPISLPVALPSKEDYRMNGFAWSQDYGIILAMYTEADQRIDHLRRLRKPKTKKNPREQM